MDAQNMSNSFNNILPNFEDVTVEPVSKEDSHRVPEKVPPDDEAQSLQSSQKMMNNHQSGIEDGSEDSNGDTSESGRKKKIESMRAEEMDEDRGEGSADDMDLDETIDSHIGVRMESERRHHIHALPLDNEEIDEDDDMGMNSVNILDTLPLEGAPIEGQEVSEADLLGKMNEDDDEDDKSVSRSGEEDDREVGKRTKSQNDDSEHARKKSKNDEDKDGGPEMESKSDKKTSNMRRNIREVMDETQLDEATLAAQRQEMERLRRVQEQQRIIREIRLPSSVQLRVNSTAASGSQTTANQANLAPRRPLGETSRWQRGQTSLSRLPGRPEGSTNAALQQRIRMMTPSVSISPVVSKKEPIEHLEYYTDSDLSDVEDIEETDEFALQEKQMQQARKLSGPPKPPKSKDVVTISSSSEEVENSDDDCIVLSDPSDSEEGDAEDDPSNSGMHTNDRYNIPDDQGRVLVNVGHPENEPDVFLAPQIARIIKPHQIGGIRFLFDNIIESIERYKTSAGFGCILAHSMGLGKTLQVATFCDIFFRCTDAKTVLCIMPINTLQNWLAEFNMWLPYENPEKPKAEEKPVIKEENSRSGLDGHDVGQMGGQHQNPAGMMMDNPYPGYNPHYGPPGGMYDPRYSSSYPGTPGYPQVKTEPSCHPQQMNPYGVPQYPPNPNYSQPMQHQPPNMQYPPNMHQTPNYPNMDPGMHNPANQMYPGYGTQSNTPYPNYGGQHVPNDPNVKKEENVKTESNLQIKEDPKKETEESKKDGAQEQKEKIKTPFSVDAPPDLETRPRHFNLHILNDSHKTMAARARVIDEWQRVGGVLLIGYELYRQLSLKKQNKAKRKRGQPFKDPSADVEEENKNKPLLEKMHTALVNPGPDLVICDEGHRIKNSHASISLALKQMRTKRRIVLTGYPLQNNLLEYWCMVDFVRPNYLGTKSEFCNMFERPIQNGQCVDSTPQDIRLMRYRAHVLHSLLVGFVQRRSHTVLQVSLPRKEEFILLVRMTTHQRKLYDVFMNEVVKKRTVPNPLKAFAVCCKIWNHPDVLYHFLKKRQANEEDDLDLEETMGEKATTPGGKRVTKPRQPKGDGKRGRKPKNKPAASIQPNTMGENKNLEGDAPKPQGYPNFNTAPVPTSVTNANPGFQNTNSQNTNYQPGDYQNYQNRPDDRTTGNYQSGDYYANQNQQPQQKYPPAGGQNFSSYPQDSNYHTTNPPQQFQGQPQNYNVPANDTNSNVNQRYSGGSNPSSYQQNQNQPIGASNAPGSFSQSNYSYQEQSKNYPQNSSQDQNCPQIPNQPQQPQPQQQQQSNYPPQNQAPNPMGASIYGSYPPQNQSQGYNSNITQNNSVNYQSGAQQPNPNLASTTNMYMNNQQQTSNPPISTNPSGYPQNQQMVNSGPQPFQNNQNAPLTQNQPHPFSMNQRENTNPASGSSSEVSFNQNQQSSQPPHAYQTSNTQNQMGGYPDGSQKPPSNYNQFNLNQPHAYSNDQQQQQQQQQQQHGYNQQTSTNNYPSPNQQTQGPPGQMSYPPNQATPVTGANEIPHGFQQKNSQQNQSSVNYPQNEQQGSFPVSDPQKTQSLENNFPTGSQNAPQNFSTANNQNSSSNQTVDNQQQQRDQYWQRNYQNNSSYPTDSNVNQYDRNYSAPGTIPGSYQANPPSQINPQSKDFSVNTLTDSKPQMEYGQQLPKNEVHGVQNPTPQEHSNPITGGLYNNSNNVQSNPGILEPPKELEKDKDVILEKGKDEEIDDDLLLKDESEKDKFLPGGLAGMMGNIKEDPGIPYDWAVELMKGYIPGLIDASTKMTLFFCILEESIRRGDRILTFSQSLFTLDLIEDFLARNSLKHDSGETENWAKNVNYFRLDGSTSALEREKLINEFNSNKKIHLFLVSTRAGSLGINLVGANRAIVFDASWNPCHDTQAVCRVYRYGQKKNCYVYRLVTDNCLERKIYDRQINKQGMADRVVDQCNPDAHLSLKEAATLSWDWEEDKEEQDFSGLKDKYTDEVMHVLLEKHSKLLTKEPFHHESLLVDRKERKLSQAEKKLARRGYEMEKMAATNSKPSYNYIPGNTATRVSVSGGLQIRQIRGDYANQTAKPVASVRPMQQRGTEGIGPRNPTGTRWIPAEVWQRQGMSAQEMTLPLDVVIPTNSPDKGSIVLKAGQKVMVLKSPKGIYMQLESGKIIAIRTALKINQQKKDEEAPKKSIAPVTPRTGNTKTDVGFPLRNNSAISIIPKTSTSNVPQNRPAMRTGINYRPFGEKEVAKRTKPVATAAAKPYSNQMTSSQVTLSRINKPKHDNPSDVSSIGENSNSSDGHRIRADQRVEEIGVEDLVGESGSNSDYSPSSKPSNSDTDSNLHRPMMETRVMPNYPLDTSPVRSQVMRTPQDSYMPEPNTSFSKKFDQKGVLGQKEKKPEMIGKDSMQHQYPHQPYNPHQQVQQHHAIPQPIVPQHQHMQPQQPQQLHQQQHRPQHPYQQQPQQMMPQQPPPQQQLQPTPHPQMQRLQQPQPVPHQAQQPRQPTTRNPPRPMLHRKNQNKSTPKNAPAMAAAVQTLDQSSSTNTSSRSKPPSVESVGSQSNEELGIPPQGYPYAQYPRYYDYEDPRSRPVADPYPPYYPSTLPPPPEHSQSSSEPPLAKEQKPSSEPTYSRVSAVPPKNPAATETPSKTPKPPEAVSSTGEESHVPTAFSHPSRSSTAYAGSYPPAAYDPYAQHYPPAPSSSTAYSAPAPGGYGAMYSGGPIPYDPHMYSHAAFPPPPAGDPYRGYGSAPPPASSNYYSAFPAAPPPPYPNYFLPPYPNPNVPAEPPQPPPAQ